MPVLLVTAGALVGGGIVFSTSADAAPAPGQYRSPRGAVYRTPIQTLPPRNAELRGQSLMRAAYRASGRNPTVASGTYEPV